MRGGVILIALALLIGYLGVSGRYKCFSLFINCIANPDNCLCGDGSGTGSGQGPIIVAPGSNSGVNPTGAPIYDATSRLAPVQALPPIEAFV